MPSFDKGTIGRKTEWNYASGILENGHDSEKRSTFKRKTLYVIMRKIPGSGGQGTSGPTPVPMALAGREAGLAVLAGTQPRHRSGLDWQRRPPGDAPGAGPRLRVVSDPREPPPQLDSSRQFSLLVEDSADRGSIGLRDNEHPNRPRPNIRVTTRKVAADWLRAPGS
jgi:hypothetical protein